MRIKVDEDLPSVIIRMLKNNGYEADSVIDQNMGGWKDPALWQVVQQEKRFLITADKGFANIRTYPPGKRCSVIETG